ncbi:MAG: SDR family oxidoreductase [Chlorobiaceae bacterium]|jgi:nucleoside-diphosphate-sugar epimerase|nr:SDR family oxidoreductase [Chlorobiaceae bacterium]
MRETVLVSGGAGYIGSILVRLLLERGFRVKVLDNLTFGGVPIIDLMNNDDFLFLKGDVRSEGDIRKALQGVDYVVHLAAIVGDPACAKEPELARSINLEGSKRMYDLANELGVRRFVFASTCSNYGKMENPDSFVNEDSTLAPVSLYAETKVAVEQYLLSQSHTNACKPTSLRFSTVYGLSPRPRFDLTVNEFTKELALGRELVVFGEQFWRPYCHVVDLCRSVIAVLEAEEEKVAFDVFNVGDTKENYQKQMIVDEIVKQLPGSRIRYVTKNEDPRDYRVSFEKIKERLGFTITKTVPDGIRQIIQVVTDGFIPDPDTKEYRNS